MRKPLLVVCAQHDRYSDRGALKLPEGATLEVIAHEDVYTAARARGLDWLLAEQEADGSWFGRWGVNHVYGTGAVLPALEACGVPPGHRSMRRAVAWLDSVQQADGGFGEDIASYGDPALRGRGVATPSQTAWALMGYVSAGAAAGSRVRALYRNGGPLALYATALSSGSVTEVLTRVDGKRVVTPMLLVMIAIGSTDLLFALDSIPASTMAPASPARSAAVSGSSRRAGR